MQKEPVGRLLKYIFGGVQKGCLVRKVEELDTLFDPHQKYTLKASPPVFIALNASRMNIFYEDINKILMAFDKKCTEYNMCWCFSFVFQLKMLPNKNSSCLNIRT